MHANPKVSVCMATYNGERFIARQLQTIAAQLKPEDEIIISDDSSTDRTLEIIRSFADPRIRLFPNQTFRSPVYNFENALRRSRGDMIFLSDQDDEWVEGWVETALAELRNVSLVVCDADIIDANGNIRNDARVYRGIRSSGVLRNLSRNGYIGCCCAFKREVLKIALPFPAKLPWHDWWLGLIADTFFNTRFIPAKMVRYRRHDANASSTGEKSNNSLRVKMGMRWQITVALVHRIVAHRLNREPY